MSAGVLPAPPRPAPRPAFPRVLGAAGGVGSSWTGGKGAGECPGEESSTTSAVSHNYTTLQHSAATIE